MCKSPLRNALNTVLSITLLSEPSYTYADETQFLPSLRAYNPIPSPDRTKIAFVVTGWRSPGGRSSLQSDVFVADADGKLLSERPLADAFLAGWTPDSKRLVCFRDWKFSLVALNGSQSRTGLIPKQESRPERVQYLSKSNRFVWLERDFGAGVVRDDNGTVLGRIESLPSELISLSPDEKWLAAISDGHLVVLNIDSKQWAKLGPITVHPDANWDYFKPSWNPWFGDSNRLAFVSEGRLVVTTPNGQDKKELCRLAGECGLASASPDGQRVAYVSFQRRPHRNRSDLEFIGDARVWVVSVENPGEPTPVTAVHRDSISSLNWLSSNELIFDRRSGQERPFSAPFSLWKAEIRN